MEIVRIQNMIFERATGQYQYGTCDRGSLTSEAHRRVPWDHADCDEPVAQGPGKRSEASGSGDGISKSQR